MRLVTLSDARDVDGQPLFVTFVNTLHWYEGVPIELIGAETELAAWLAELALPAGDLDSCLPAVHALREHLRGVIKALVAQQHPDAADMAALTSALGAALGHVVLTEETPSQLAFATDASDVDLFVFQVALSAATFLERGDRKRLKLCANPGCGFAFFDTSTNATRRWCDMRYCGNRLKVRAFRGRSRAAQA